MQNTMSLQARKELLNHIQKSYQFATHKEKSKILDGFVAATKYQRKYAIQLLKRGRSNKSTNILRKQKYGPEVHQALVTLWEAANHICSKRLVPFLPELINVLECLCGVTTYVVSFLLSQVNSL